MGKRRLVFNNVKDRYIRAYVLLVNADPEEVRKHPVQVLMAGLPTSRRTAERFIRVLQRLELIEGTHRAMRLVRPLPGTVIESEDECWALVSSGAKENVGTIVHCATPPLSTSSGRFAVNLVTFDDYCATNRRGEPGNKVVPSFGRYGIKKPRCTRGNMKTEVAKLQRVVKSCRCAPEQDAARGALPTDTNAGARRLLFQYSQARRKIDPAFDPQTPYAQSAAVQVARLLEVRKVDRSAWRRYIEVLFERAEVANCGKMEKPSLSWLRSEKNLDKFIERYCEAVPDIEGVIRPFLLSVEDGDLVNPGIFVSLYKHAMEDGYRPSDAWRWAKEYSSFDDHPPTLNALRKFGESGLYKTAWIYYLIGERPVSGKTLDEMYPKTPWRA